VQRFPQKQLQGTTTARPISYLKIMPNRQETRTQKREKQRLRGEGGGVGCVAKGSYYHFGRLFQLGLSYKAVIRTRYDSEETRRRGLWLNQDKSRHSGGRSSWKQVLGQCF
jgi:hypothetical protein